MTETRTSPELASGSIRREIRDRLLAAEADRVLTIYLHGSRVSGQARPRSDWDVVVVLRDPVDDWVDTSRDLATLFYAQPFAVDLQAFGECEFRDDADVPGTLAYAVSRRGELLYSADASTNRDRSRVDRIGAR